MTTTFQQSKFVFQHPWMDYISLLLNFHISQQLMTFALIWSSTRMKPLLHTTHKIWLILQLMHLITHESCSNVHLQFRRWSLANSVLQTLGRLLLLNAEVPDKICWLRTFWQLLLILVGFERFALLGTWNRRVSIGYKHTLN